MITENRVSVNGIALEMISASELRIIRGSDPYAWQILVSDADVAKWRALKNPVAITFQSDASGGEKITFRLKKWYIVSIMPNNTKTWKVTICDVRSQIQKRSFEGSWNIESADGQQRGNTFAQPKQSTCIEAATEAMAKMGEKVIIDVDPELQKILLPKNLGDSAGSGFTEGTIRTVEIFLEFCRCDLLPSPDGTIIFSDRHTDKTKGLLKTPTYDGNLDKRDFHWGKPKYIITNFEQRIERIFDVAIGVSATGLFGNEFDLQVTNVIPDFDIFKLPEQRANGSNIIQYLNFQDFLALRCNLDYQTFLDRFFKATAIPNQPGQELLISKRRSYEGIARQNLFSYWKVEYASSGIGRNWEKVRLGRLSPKGMNLPNQSVFIDYTEYAVMEEDSKIQGAPVEIVHSQKFRFNSSIPAPVTASWQSDGNYALVFGLSFGSRLFGERQFQLGLIDPDVGYGDSLDVSDPRAVMDFPDHCRILPRLQMRVFWNGLFVASAGKSGFARLYSIKNKAFPEGPEDSITIKIRNTLALWGYTDGSFPGALLNEAELKARAEQVTQQIMQTFNEGQAGISTSSGVKHLKSYWVGGNIYDIAVGIGLSQPWSISTTINVIPEVRSNIISSRADLDGVKPELVG